MTLVPQVTLVPQARLAKYTVYLLAEKGSDKIPRT
jgi:hypothetical protein